MQSIENLEDGMHRKITRATDDRANRSDVKPSRTTASKRRREARRRVRLARRANR